MAAIGLVLASAAVVLMAIPIWSFVRIVRLTRELDQLRARVAELERGQHRPAAPYAPSTAAAPPVPPIAPPDTSPAPMGPEQGAPPLSPSATTVVTAGVETAAPDDLEVRVGGRWLLYVGVAILLLGVSFFLKYAVDNAWLDERARVILGAALGLALTATGWRWARRLPLFGLALTGTGIASLYLSIYAAHEFYYLIGATAAFLLLAVTTALATWLADRGRLQTLGLIAVTGGYATPFLISSPNPSASRLFSYDLLLGMGVLALTRRHRWLALPVLAYLLTSATLVAWADAHYTADQWLTVLPFLTVFCAVFVEILRFVRRLQGWGARVAAGILWTAPLAYHVVAVTLTVEHPPAVHVYLIAFSAIGIVLTASASGWLRVLVLLAAYVPLFGYVQIPQGASWLGPNLVTAAAIAALHVMAFVDRATRRARRPTTGDFVVLHASLIGLYGLAAQMLAGPYPEWPGGVAASLALLSSGLWFFFERRDPIAALNAAGLSFTLVALALSARFEGPVVVIGWAVEGAVAAWIGLRTSSAAFRFGGLALFVLAAARLADGYFDSEPVRTVIVNDRTAATAVLVGLAYVVAWHWRQQVTRARAIATALYVTASVFTMMWLSTEIDLYWRGRPDDVQARLAEELMRSLAWGVYGASLVAVGMWRQLASLRWIGIAVIGLTVLKVFFVDLSELGGIYRVIGFLVVGILLVGVSYLYQRGRDERRRDG